MFAGLTISGAIITIVICFYFRNVIRTVANATEDAILDVTEAASDQVAGYAVTMTRDAIVESQDAINELNALLADPNVMRPSDWLRQQRKNRQNARKTRQSN